MARPTFRQLAARDAARRLIRQREQQAKLRQRAALIAQRTSTHQIAA